MPQESTLLFGQIDLLLNNRKFFRVLLVCTGCSGILLDTEVEAPLNAVYIIVCLLGGLAFEQLWVLAVIAATTTCVKYLVNGTTNLEVMLFNCLGYFLLCATVSLLVGHYLSIRQHVSNFTYAMVKALDSRDKYTAYHSRNVARYAKLIGEQLGLPARRCNELFIGGLLHDVGKIGVPEAILNKAAPLTIDEFKQVQSHTTIGYEMLSHSRLLRRFGVLSIIRNHHEKLDGSGYPDRLRGDEIPLTVRIVAVADAFDAMTSGRIYSSGRDFGSALEELQKNVGTQFDKDVVQALSCVLERAGFSSAG